VAEEHPAERAEDAAWVVGEEAFSQEAGLGEAAEGQGGSATGAGSVIGGGADLVEAAGAGAGAGFERGAVGVVDEVIKFSCPEFMLSRREYWRLRVRSKRDHVVGFAIRKKSMKSYTFLTRGHTDYIGSFL
jgi:hypothetical protein